MAKQKAGYRSGRDDTALAENIELLTGQRGNGLDKAITFRELADIGLITLRKAANNKFNGSPAPGLFPDENIQRPVAPTGVIANGAFHTVLVEWDTPAYSGHAYAEVWRAQEDNRAKAVMVGSSSANLYSDAIGKGASVYYWVRFVNRLNVAGPFNAVAGTHAETSRDVQDILDELQGKISESHLTKELLAPIKDISQIKADMGEIDDALARTNAALSALDQRERQVTDLLNSAQSQLGNSYLNVTTIQETLRQKIDSYRSAFDSFRDAVFSVDPTTGEITMDAVNAVRSELGTEISLVSQHLNAVEAIVNTCVTRAEITADLERITNVEQQIDGINATLTQTATKSEVTSIASTVSQVQQTLDATNNALTQKAAQTQVDSQGQRLSSAEQQISANTQANSATAQKIDQVKAQLEQADAVIASSITTLSQAVATDKAATAQTLAAIQASIDGHSSAITELNKVVTGDGQSLAGRFESIQASIDQTAKSGIGSTLASAEADRQARKASGQIRRDQEVIVSKQQAQAQTIEDMRVTFEGGLSDTNARITTLQTTLSDADKAIAERVDSIDSAYKAADQQAASSITSLQQAMNSADSALAQSISRIESEYKSADSATASSISSLQKTVSDADKAIGVRIDQVIADYKAGDIANSSAIQSEQAARSDADGALGRRIDTVQAAANGLLSAVQTNSQAISDLKAGAEAMWTVKAQAGDIKAGIGLVAKSDGTSQVMVSASQFFVFNPNSPSATSPLFAIDNGQVVMAEAIIRTATIQILNSQQITADYLKAGVSISAPVINGGSISIGSNFIVTSSGAMTAWSCTLRYVTSYYGTFNDATINRATIDAATITSATITSATIRNCVITEDCTVLGKFYAKNMLGDVAAVKAVSVNTTDSVYDKTVVSETIKAAEFSRDLFVDGMTVNISNYEMPTAAGSVVIRARLLRGSTTLTDACSYIKKDSTAGTGVTKVLKDRDVVLPAVLSNGIGLAQAAYSVAVSVYWQPTSGSASYGVIPFSVVGVATIKVQKTASDTFA